MVQVECDKCKRHVKECGRLHKLQTSGITWKLCKDCRTKIKEAWYKRISISVFGKR